VDAGGLVRAMLGSDAAPLAIGATDTHRARRAHGPPVAVLDGVTVRDESGRVAVDGVSLAVHRGEIVGITGIEGGGQRELALLLAGRLRPDNGTASVPAGVGLIPQDRTEEGLIGAFDLAENVALALHGDARVADKMRIRWEDVRAMAEDVRARFAVVSPGLDTAVATLSGGNQQRLVVGRELLVASDLLVADNPARGLDVAATAFVHAELDSLTSQENGPGVVLVSSDLDEALELADRLFVMSGGRLLEVPEAERTREGVGALMLRAGG
jgi:simple sugar transport system ATP-binding protein